MKTAPPPALHRALELREEGKSQRAIAEILEAEGVPLPPGRARAWSQKAVERLFQRFEAPATPAPTSPAPVPSPTPPPLLAVDALAAALQRVDELLDNLDQRTAELGRWVERQEAIPRQIDRDMPPLGGPPWVPVGWRPRLLLGLAIVLGGLLAGGATTLYFTFGPPAAELQRYKAAWHAMTPEQQQANNKQRLAPGKE